MATIRDIAKESGISAGAVSRILNNDITLNVTPETRARVLDIAKRLKYVKKNRAHTPKKSSFTMGIIQWYTAEEELRDNYYLRVRQGVEDFCSKHSIDIVHVFPDDTDTASRLSSVNGLVCIGKFSREKISEYNKLCSNTVFLDTPVENSDLSSVSMDFYHAVKDVLDYLTELGHTEIGMLAGREFVGIGEEVSDARISAFRRYMKYHDLFAEQFVREGSFSSQSGYEMMSDLISSGKLPTAVFATSDSIAIGAMRAIQDNHLRIPEDISIIGFNNEDTCAYMNPPLTTVNAPAYDMGQYGANLVYTASNMNIKTPLQAHIPCSLIRRQSCSEKKDTLKNN